MKERFIDGFVTKLSDSFDIEQLSLIKLMLCKYCENYEITNRCTDLVVKNQIPDCLKVYLVTKKIEGLSEGTLKQYAIRLKQMFEIINRPLNEITTNDVRIFLYKLQETSGMSDRTLDGVRSVVSTFFKWATAEGYIDKDVSATIKHIKYTERPRGHLNESEIEQMRDCCSSDRDRALFEILYSTGCRVSEVIGMDVSDIDLDKCEINVLGKGNKYRTVYINARAKIAVQKYLNTRNYDSEALFTTCRAPHKRIGKAGIERVIGTLGEQAGIERKVFPHLIRHSTATHCIERKMDVVEIQKMLGHSNLQTTMIYAEVADKSVKDSHRRCIV